MSCITISNAEARAVAIRLSKRMRGVLIEHGDGPQMIIAGREFWLTVLSLRNRNLLRLGHHSSIRPKETVATTLGRQVIAALLAIEADKLAIMEDLRDDALSRGATTSAAPIPKRSAPIRS